MNKLHKGVSSASNLDSRAVNQRASESMSVTAYGPSVEQWLFKMVLAVCLSFCLLLLLSGTVRADSMTDRVLVIINEDVITQSEFDYRRATVVGDLNAAGRPIPPNLNKQLLDTMVSDRLQVQEAQRRGIDVSDEELQQALGRFAAQQNLTTAQLKQSVEASGQPFEAFSSSVRDSLIISRFTEFYARSRVVVPDYEIEGFLATNPVQQNDEYELAQILIRGDDQTRESAQQVRDEIARGMSFQQAVAQFSDAPDAAQGGVIGWRTADQLPALFVDAVKDLQVGDISDLIQTPNGFHILKLLNFKGERTEILQNNVRHILISAESRVAKSQARKRALQIRQRIIDGEDFETLARIFSDDSGSAALGGGLGWVSPGEMVPPFEKAYNELAINEVSQPVESRFGVHIIRVEDRRKKNVTEQIRRARADSILRRQRADREFGQWVRELMEGAYIKHVAEPV